MTLVDDPHQESFLFRLLDNNHRLSVWDPIVQGSGSQLREELNSPHVVAEKIFDSPRLWCSAFDGTLFRQLGRHRPSHGRPVPVSSGEADVTVLDGVDGQEALSGFELVLAHSFQEFENVVVSQFLPPTRV